MVNSVFKVHNVDMRYTKKIIAAFATILLVMTTAITVKAEVDIDSTFKDEAFRKYIETFDRNGDGALDDEEISDIKAIHIIDDKNGTIKDLAGIEYLTSLEVLEIANMQITDVDLTKNTSLKEVYLMNDKIETLDITGIKTLKAFAISQSSIKSLDLSANKELESLVIIGLADLDELKLDGLDKLSGLQTEDTAITKLDLKDKTALTALYLSNNKLIGLDLSNSTSLKVLLIDKNPLVYLNLSNSPYLTYDNSTENTIDGVIGPDYDITKELPGFDIERIKDLKETTLSDGKFSDLSLGPNKISYYYEITTGKYLDVDLTINVTKLIPQVTIVGNPSHIHGEEMNIKVESDSNGDRSFEYQEFKNNAWQDLSTSPEDVGLYRVKAIVKEDGDYTEGESDWKTFIIVNEVGDVSISNDLSKEYDGQQVSNPQIDEHGSKGKLDLFYYEVLDDKHVKLLEGKPSDVGSYRLVVLMYEDDYHTGDITYEDFEIRKGHNEWLSDLVVDGSSIKMPESKYGEPYLVYSLSEDGPYSPNAITEGSYYVVAVVDASENYDKIYTQPVLVINYQSETKDDDEEIAQKESPKEFDPNDKNKDGVVSCDELLGEGWIWDESVKACIYPSSIIPNTGTK